MTETIPTGLTATDLLELEHAAARRLQGWVARVTARWRLTGAALADLGAAVLALGLLGSVPAAAWPLGVVSLAVAWVGVLGLTACYRAAGATTGSTLGPAAPFRAAGLAALVLWVGSGLSLVPLPATEQLLLVALLVAASSTWRLLARLGLRALAHLGRVDTRPTRLLLLGNAADVEQAEASLRRPQHTGLPGRGCEVVAACVAGGQAPGLAVPTLTFSDDGSWSALRAAVACHRADAVLALPGAGLDWSDLRRVSWSLEKDRVPLLVGTALRDVAVRRARISTSGGVALVQVTAAGGTSGSRLVKAAAERALALALLVLLLPALAALVVAIRVESAGPALFRQTRVGRSGREFTMLKLRTMTADADQVDLGGANDCQGVLFKLRDDPRVTGLGRHLRRYSLDEIPQLWHVVRGDMALVGPRPALPAEVRRYDVDARRRLSVRPGLTGLWQVSGRSELSWADTVRYDVAYVDNWSLGLDLSILARTFGAVVGHRGAY